MKRLNLFQQKTKENYPKKRSLTTHKILKQKGL